MTDKEFAAMSLFEQMAWIGHESEKILKPLAEESRRETREQIERWQHKDKENERF